MAQSESRGVQEAEGYRLLLAAGGGKKDKEKGKGRGRERPSDIIISSVSRLLLSMERGTGSPRGGNNTSGVRKEKEKNAPGTAAGETGIPVWLDRECGYGAPE